MFKKKIKTIVNSKKPVSEESDFGKKDDTYMSETHDPVPHRAVGSKDSS
jgi:hypothetical protein